MTFISFWKGLDHILDTKSLIFIKSLNAMAVAFWLTLFQTK